MGLWCPQSCLTIDASNTGPAYSLKNSKCEVRFSSDAHLPYGCTFPLRLPYVSPTSPIRLPYDVPNMFQIISHVSIHNSLRLCRYSISPTRPPLGIPLLCSIPTLYMAASPHETPQLAVVDAWPDLYTRCAKSRNSRICVWSVNAVHVLCTSSAFQSPWQGCPRANGAWAEGQDTLQYHGWTPLQYHGGLERAMG